MPLCLMGLTSGNPKTCRGEGGSRTPCDFQHLCGVPPILPVPRDWEHASPSSGHRDDRHGLPVSTHNSMIYKVKSEQRGESNPKRESQEDSQTAMSSMRRRTPTDCFPHGGNLPALSYSTASGRTLMVSTSGVIVSFRYCP